MSDLIVPRLGESISEAIIAKWLKQVGEPVAVDEPVVELETDKVSVSIPAPESGVLADQRFPVGATVTVGAVLGSVNAGAALKRKPATAAASAVTSGAATAPTAAAAAAASAAPAGGTAPRAEGCIHCDARHRPGPGGGGAVRLAGASLP